LIQIRYTIYSIQCSHAITQHSAAHNPTGLYENSSWYHPKTKVGYTIDYCILSANLKSALYDSGVNYANEFSDIDSDHYPVFIDLCINSCHKDSKKFKYLKKKEDVQNRNINLDYSVLKNEFEIANNLNQDILYNLSNYENVTMTEFLQLVGVSCAKFLPNKDMKSKSNRNWLNNKEVNDLFYYRRLAQHLWWNDQDNQYLYNNYNVIKYACRKKLRKFKCDFYKDKSRRMMEAFNSNNMSLFYECSKNYFYKKKINLPDHILNVNGTLTKNKIETTSRIEEHFNMLLNQTSNISPNINELLPIQDIFKFELEDLFNIDELNKALFEMKDSKACGADRIPIEFFKYTSCEDMKKYIYYFFQQVLNRRRRNTRCYKKCNNFGNI
jgi:hypothetical protein